MVKNQEEALQYIMLNNDYLLNILKDGEVKTIFSNKQTKINILREGKHIIKSINQYGDKKLSNILKEMIDCKLF